MKKLRILVVIAVTITLATSVTMLALSHGTIPYDQAERALMTRHELTFFYMATGPPIVYAIVSNVRSISSSVVKAWSKMKQRVRALGFTFLRRIIAINTFVVNLKNIASTCNPLQIPCT